MNDHDFLSQRILRFKMELLGKMPFYGDLLMNLVIAEDRSIESSCTNGRVIRYNPDYLSAHSEGEQNYILMHELMHILFLHCARGAGKIPGLFNAAADMMVNSELAELESSMHRAGIAFKAPVEGIRAAYDPGETVENLYEKLLKDNPQLKPGDAASEKEKNPSQTQGNGASSRNGSQNPLTQGRNAFSSGNDGTKPGNTEEEILSENAPDQPLGGILSSFRRLLRRAVSGAGRKQDSEDPQSRSGTPGSSAHNQKADSARTRHDIQKGGPRRQAEDGARAVPGTSKSSRREQQHTGSGLLSPAGKDGSSATLRRSYASGWQVYTALLPDDLEPGIPPEELRQELDSLLEHAGLAKDRSPSGSYYIPPSLYRLDYGKLLNWDLLLKRFLSEEQETEERSYAAPDRKYLYRDMILPGPDRKAETLGTVWAFADSSCSVSREEMSRFLTQLFHIIRKYRCRMNLAYWDTQVTDLYRNITRPEQLTDSLPQHSGGTDINCVYAWLKENGVRADVILILTDGYFGTLRPENRLPGIRRKTILVLSEEGLSGPEAKALKQYGKIAKLA